MLERLKTRLPDVKDLTVDRIMASKRPVSQDRMPAIGMLMGFMWP